ncbi:hypothetical protein CDAR_432991 [Caerostris darwini]|uniref:Uncharacterized protein n=1 Tax=Caerostris darwini TaxID=1538125 RepID=A0AAV4QGZ9_9ARAC|nr:hypothetical protein CDAR_432991 [Caerostris darwini]
MKSELPPLTNGQSITIPCQKRIFSYQERDRGRLWGEKDPKRRMLIMETVCVCAFVGFLDPSLFRSRSLTSIGSLRTAVNINLQWVSLFQPFWLEHGGLRTAAIAYDGKTSFEHRDERDKGTRKISLIPAKDSSDWENPAHNRFKNPTRTDRKDGTEIELASLLSIAVSLARNLICRIPPLLLMRH